MKKNLMKVFVAALFASFVIGMTGCANGSSVSKSSGASDFLDDKDGLLDDFKDKDVIAWFMWDIPVLRYQTMQKAYIFFEDKTYCLSNRVPGEADAEAKGTYTGDPTVNGKVVLNETHIEFNDGGKRGWKEHEKSFDFEIKDDAYVVKYYNGADYYYRQ